MKRQFTVLLFSLIFVKLLNAQQALSLEFMTIGFHFFGNPNLQFYENKLDSLGVFNTEPGAMLSYEFYIKKNYMSIQLSQGFFSDAGAMIAGFSKISFRYMFFHKFRNQLYLDIAPAISYRESWKKFGAGYVAETKYRYNGNIEYKFSLIGKLEYDIYLGKRIDINMSIMYGHSYKTFTYLLGVRFWLNPYVKLTDDCDCPKFNNRKSPFRAVRRYFKNLFRIWKTSKR
ncbi:MAG: hypothetical protein N3A01_08650 [Bacteroidales bacterium]|nr:hypothetical protein [Bacteroidales bacterium]